MKRPTLTALVLVTAVGWGPTHQAGEQQALTNRWCAAWVGGATTFLSAQNSGQATEVGSPLKTHPQPWALGAVTRVSWLH